MRASSTLVSWLAPLAFVVLVAGCTPTLTPLYRDYQAPDTSDAVIYDRITGALKDAGWTVGDEEDPLAITTEPRNVQQWGLYRVDVVLEVLPMGGRHVRVFFHPYRRYFTGYRSTIPYLPSGVRRALVPGLNEAFDEHGLTIVQPPRERDRLAGAR